MQGKSNLRVTTDNIRISNYGIYIKYDKICYASNTAAVFKQNLYKFHGRLGGEVFVCFASILLKQSFRVFFVVANTYVI
jgi:hypothetical protein